MSFVNWKPHQVTRYVACKWLVRRPDRADQIAYYSRTVRLYSSNLACMPEGPTTLKNPVQDQRRRVTKDCNLVEKLTWWMCGHVIYETYWTIAYENLRRNRNKIYSKEQFSLSMDSFITITVTPLPKLNVDGSAFAEACFWGLSGIHKTYGHWMQLVVLYRQPPCWKSPHNWSVI